MSPKRDRRTGGCRRGRWWLERRRRRSRWCGRCRCDRRRHGRRRYTSHRYASCRRTSRRCGRRGCTKQSELVWTAYTKSFMNRDNKGDGALGASVPSSTHAYLYVFLPASISTYLLFVYLSIHYLYNMCICIYQICPYIQMCPYVDVSIP